MTTGHRSAKPSTVKATLTRTTAPLVLAVSDHIYRSIIRHGYDGIDDQAFKPLVRIKLGGNIQHGWYTYLPFVSHP